MSELIIHIGMPKAGSSTIQRLLWKNRSRLEALSIGYALESDPRLLAYARGRDPNYRPTWLDKMPRHQRFILSYEKLFSKVAKPAEARRIIELFSGHFSRCSVLCYLRRQDEVAVSGYSTYLLNGGTQGFEELTLPQWSILDRLNAWSHAVGWENISARRFGSQYFVSGDFIADALGALRIPAHAVDQVRSANVSPCIETLEYLRLINQHLADLPNRRAIAKAIFALPRRGLRLGLARNKREGIVAPFVAGNNEISRRFFNDDTLFPHEYADDGVAPVVLTNRVIAEITTALSKMYKKPPHVPEDITIEHAADIVRKIQIDQPVERVPVRSTPP